MSIVVHGIGVSMSCVLDEKRPARLARPAVAARPVVEAVAHLLRAQGLAAMIACDHRIEIVSAFAVLEDQRRLAARKPIVAPAQHRDQWPIEILALFGQGIFVTFGLILIFAPHEDSFRDQPVETVSEDVWCDTELVLKVIEAAHSEKGFTNDHEAPSVANYFQCLCDRTRTAPIQYSRVGRPPAALSVNDLRDARTWSIPIFHPRSIDFFLAVRTGDNRPTHFTAKIVNEIDRRLGCFL